jgi:spore coat polysaccharide biosynthesis protein SpsF
MTYRLIRVFVQARMSSQRFPGKVLALFRGRPLIWHVVRAVDLALGPTAPATVVTSVEPSDDPLAQYLADERVDVFRGDLDNVFGRFRAAAATRPSDWILRVNADSPLLSPDVLRRVVAAREAGCDVVTTTQPTRTFPAGQNAELIRASLFASIADADMNDHDREHVTPFFYRHPDRFRILGVRSSDPKLADASTAVDTIDDLRRLEAMTTTQLAELVRG